MIYLSAQPDGSYFAWQLEVQLQNFRKFGIGKKNIHVLVGYIPSAGINFLFQDLIERFKDTATFYCYPDCRENKKYAPSIRPFLIKQHFKKYKFLETETIFYHDCDIIFTTKLPDFKKLIPSDAWYFSDARLYLDSKYIRRHGESVFKDMCELVDIDEQKVISNDSNAGGAQVVLKKVDYKFWEDLERDCTLLFTHLKSNQERYAAEFDNKVADNTLKYEPISAWCADMWALLWNALKRNVSVKITKELDFCWPHEPIVRWEQCNIFHNAGISDKNKDKYFYKVNYLRKEPFDYSHDFVLKNSCSYKYVSEIVDIKQDKKYQLRDTTFYFIIEKQQSSIIEKIKLATEYLHKYFEARIMLIAYDLIFKHKDLTLPDTVKLVNLGKKNNSIEAESALHHFIKTKIMVRCDLNIFVPPSQLYKAAISIRKRQFDFCYSHSGHMVFVNRREMQEFRLNRDIKVLTESKITSHTEIDRCLRVIAMNTTAFFDLRLGSPNIRSSKYKDLELYIKYKTSSYKTGSVEGAFFVSRNNYKNSRIGLSEDLAFLVKSLSM